MVISDLRRRRRVRRLPTSSALLLGAAISASISAPVAACTGDCNADNRVLVDELITGVTIGLDSAPPDRCLLFDEDDDGSVAINELIIGVENALNGCSAWHVAAGAVNFLRAVLDPLTTGGLPRNEATKRQLELEGLPPVDFFVPAQAGVWISAAVLSHALRSEHSEFLAGFTSDELIASAEALVAALENIVERYAFTDPITGGKALYQVHHVPNGDAPLMTDFERTVPLLDNALLIAGLEAASAYLRSLDSALSDRIDTLLGRFDLAMWVDGQLMRIGALGAKDPRTGISLDRIVSEGRLAAVAARGRGELDGSMFSAIIEAMIQQSSAGLTEGGVTVEHLPFFGTALEIWSPTPYLTDELVSRLGTGTLLTLVPAWEETRTRIGLPAAGATGISSGRGTFLTLALSPAENTQNALLDRRIVVPPAVGIQAGAVGGPQPLALKNLERTFRVAKQSGRFHALYGLPNYLDFGTGLVNEENPVRGTLEIGQMAVALLNHLLGAHALSDLLKMRPGWSDAFEEYVGVLNGNSALITVHQYRPH